MKYLTVFLAASCFPARVPRSVDGREPQSGLAVLFRVATAFTQRRQVASAIIGKPNASVWSGTAGSWVGQLPAGALYSEGRGAYGNRQVGNALFNGFFHGGVWTGTAAHGSTLRLRELTGLL